MANEFVDVLRPRDFCRETSTGYDAAAAITFSGDVGCLTFPKLANQGYTTIFVIPAELTMGTGLTFGIFVTDDGANSNDLGKVVRFGLTPKLLASGTDDFDIDTGAATETTVDVTLDATSGQFVNGSAAIANAALDSAAVGGILGLRVRRIGSHANDTCTGRVLVGAVYIKNT